MFLKIFFPFLRYLADKEITKEWKEYIKKQTHMTDEEIDRPYTTNRDVYYTPCEALKWEIANEIKSYEN